MTRRHRHSRVALGAVVLAGALAGTAVAQSPLPQGSETVQIDPADFTTKIDNPYWPMKPGTKWVSRETDSEGARQRVVVKVTHKTRRIANGVTARVVSDVVTEHGRPVEKTRDWYAQDRQGNIWYLGEHTTEYGKNGKPKSTEGSFEAGVDGAQPGVILPAEPRVGLTYRQEYYAGHAEDMGAIFSLDEQAGTPFRHFPHTLMTKEWNPLEPRALEFKFYARGVGPVLAVSVSGGSDREELVHFRPAR